MLGGMKMENREIVSKTPHGIERGLHSAGKWMAVVGASALTLMMLLTVIDVTGRYFFNAPLFGTYEMVELLLIVAGTWGMAACQMERSHITVGIVVDKLPLRAQAIIRSIALFLSAGLFAVITWQMLVLTVRYIERGKAGITADLGISLVPFSIMFAMGTAAFSLVLLLHLVQSLIQVRKA